MGTGHISLAVNPDDRDVAYLSLPDHPGKGTPGVVSKTVRLASLLPYKGPDLYLDFDAQGRLIGVEVLV
jgi:Protein of unknown function (DUF2283)